MSNAQQRLKEIEQQEKALAEEKKKLLVASKEEDLQLVRNLCKLHGFTATQLRGCLVGRGKKKTLSDEVVPKKAGKKST